jgi:hypothetical protein
MADRPCRGDSGRRWLDNGGAPTSLKTGVHSLGGGDEMRRVRQGEVGTGSASKGVGRVGGGRETRNVGARGGG